MYSLGIKKTTFIVTFIMYKKDRNHGTVKRHEIWINEDHILMPPVV